MFLSWVSLKFPITQMSRVTINNRLRPKKPANHPAAGNTIAFDTR
jgi:hypothetical protein